MSPLQRLVMVPEKGRVSLVVTVVDCAKAVVAATAKQMDRAAINVAQRRDEVG